VEQQDEIYLDYAAATPVDPRVRAAMEPYFSHDFYNPSSPYAPAVKLRREYESAKARLAATFGAKADEVIITGGATESINLAFSAVNGHVVTSAIEHPAVLEAAKRKPSFTLVKPTEKGIITTEAVKAAIQPDTQLVSIQLANNELGTIQPLRDIATIIQTEKQARAAAGNMTPLLFHADASQGFGQVDVHVARLGVDMLTLNSAKMYGPKGVGLLWTKPNVRINPLIVGGGQERGLRSGTENVVGLIGFAKAAELAASHAKSEHVRLAKLRDTLQDKLVAAFPCTVVSGHNKKRLSGHLHISFPDVDGERLIFLLEQKQVYLATGSACAANKGTRSHVLEAIGLEPYVADGSLRITLGRHTAEEQIKAAAEYIKEAVKSEYVRTGKQG
jgi:cysteine desulfurase